MSREVVGVMPADFRFPSAKTQIWIPLHADPRTPATYWAGDFMPVVGRLLPGVTLEQAGADVRRFQTHVPALFPWAMPASWNANVSVVPLQSGMVADVRARLLMLLGVVGLVLVDRVRERRQSDARARRVTDQGNQRSTCARRRTTTHRPAIADRKCRPCIRGWRARAGDRSAGPRVAEATAAAGNASPCRRPHRLARARVYRRPRRRHGPGFRTGPCPSGIAYASHRAVAERRARRGVSRCLSVCAARWSSPKLPLPSCWSSPQACSSAASMRCHR